MYKNKKISVFSSKIFRPTVILTYNWSCIFVNGSDSQQYLQGQLTIDVSCINNDQHYLSGYCNNKGKIWSVFRIFKYKNGFLCILRQSVANRILLEFKKYSIFSDVNIVEKKSLVLIGIVGFNVKEILKENISFIDIKKKYVFYIDQMIILKINIPQERFLCILHKSVFKNLKRKIFNNLYKGTISQWDALDIESGYPIIDYDMMLKFFPQDVNLESLNGISFKKGCYLGQEVISRIHFKKINKKKLYCLVGYSKYIPNIGTILKIKSSNKELNSGIVLKSIFFENFIFIQTVFSKDLNFQKSIYIENFKSFFNVI